MKRELKSIESGKRFRKFSTSYRPVINCTNYRSQQLLALECRIARTKINLTVPKTTHLKVKKTNSILSEQADGENQKILIFYKTNNSLVTGVWRLQGRKRNHKKTVRSVYPVCSFCSVRSVFRVLSNSFFGILLFFWSLRSVCPVHSVYSLYSVCLISNICPIFFAV